MRRFRQLSVKDRGKIARMHNRGYLLSEIADKLGVHKSTISREMQRNGTKRRQDPFWKQMSLDLGDFDGYLNFIAAAKSKYLFSAIDAQNAFNQRQALANKRRKKRIPTAVQKWVKARLRDHWSPEQIAGRSKVDGPGKVSHTFIYRLIERDRKEGGNLFRLLRRSRKKGRFLGKIEKNKIPDRVDIRERPKIVDKRKRLGDLEGDLVMGIGHRSSLVVIVDRSSRMYFVERLRNRNKIEVRRLLTKMIRRMRKPVHTLTLDNGLDFWDHEKLSQKTGAKVYFATPYASWERGTIENQNGLLRQFFPKKTDFRKIKEQRLKKVEKALNHRPRKCLDYRTPFEVHHKRKIDSKKSSKDTRLRL